MTPGIVAKCGDFSCSISKDIDDFFHGEYVSYAKNLYCKSYCFIHKVEKKIVAAFTLSATSISVNNNKKLDRESIEANVAEGDQLPQYPAILLGQLAVFDDFRKRKLGYEVLTFIKTILSERNPIDEDRLGFNSIAAKFILVDAKNVDYIIKMYKDCGFLFAFSEPIIDAKSHKMFFDLTTIK